MNSKEFFFIKQKTTDEHEEDNLKISTTGLGKQPTTK